MFRVYLCVPSNTVFAHCLAVCQNRKKTAGFAVLYCRTLILAYWEPARGMRSTEVLFKVQPFSTKNACECVSPSASFLKQSRNTLGGGVHCDKNDGFVRITSKRAEERYCVFLSLSAVTAPFCCIFFRYHLRRRLARNKELLSTASWVSKDLLCSCTTTRRTSLLKLRTVAIHGRYLPGACYSWTGRTRFRRRSHFCTIRPKHRPSSR